MRVPVAVAWLLLTLTFFTAGLLRQFHDRTPEAPHASPIVGSLLFAIIFVLLLVSAREWRRGAVAGPGVRLGSLTPILLMLLVEKWFSLILYPTLFFRWTADRVGSAALDAQYRGFAGATLVLVCVLLGALSRPARYSTWRRVRPSCWPRAALASLAVVGGCYLLLGGLNAALEGGLRLRLPRSDRLLPWILAGQAVLALGEELYFRGLLLAEVQRLGPRLGLGSAAARRWLALLSTAALFGLEHLTLGPPWEASLRELVFTLSLGVLFGLLVLVSANLVFTAAVHCWINWLLLGAAPHFVDAEGRPGLPSGTYIGLTLVLAFVLAFLVQRRQATAAARAADALAG